VKDVLQQIADNVDQLTRAQTTSVEYTRQPGTGADGIHRRSPEHGRHAVRQPPLLLALIEAMPPGAVAGAEPTSRGKPRSRPPSYAPATAAFDRVVNGWATRHDYTPGVWELRRYLRRAAGRQTPDTPRTRVGLTTALHDIRGLAHALGEDHRVEVARVTGLYVAACREALAYEAPLATLRDVACRYCGGPLRVRSDASSDVTCATHGCVDEGGRRPRWARETWHLLLVDEQTVGDVA